LTLHAVRVVLALSEMAVRRRCWVWTARRRGKASSFTPRFTTGELSAFLGLPEKKARLALKELQLLGLVEFSETRLVVASSLDDVALTAAERVEFEEWLSKLTPRASFPIPRSILALACESSSRAFIATVLGVCLRCSWYYPSRKEWRGRGRLSLSWLSESFGVCPRALKSAKKQLMGLGWIHQEQTSRFGDRLIINPAWRRWVATKEFGGVGEHASAPAAGPKNAPPPPHSGPKNAPPKREENLPTEGKYQRQSPPERREPPGPGVQIQGIQKPQDNSPEIPPPRLSQILPADFRDVGRALELFRQAAKCGLVPNSSEHSRLLWMAAIERARTVPARSPAAVFLYLVKNRKWDYLSDGHFEAANARLKAHLHGPRGKAPPIFVPIGRKIPAAPPRPQLSKDALLVQVVRNELARRGHPGDIFPALRAHAGFTRERFEAAVAEIDNRGRNFAHAV
jgi:hypothetical protein